MQNRKTKTNKSERSTRGCPEPRQKAFAKKPKNKRALQRMAEKDQDHTHTHTHTRKQLESSLCEDFGKSGPVRLTRSLSLVKAASKQALREITTVTSVCLFINYDNSRISTTPLSNKRCEIEISSVTTKIVWTTDKKELLVGSLRCRISSLTILKNPQLNQRTNTHPLGSTHSHTHTQTDTHTRTHT